MIPISGQSIISHPPCPQVGRIGKHGYLRRQIAESVLVFLFVPEYPPKLHSFNNATPPHLKSTFQSCRITNGLNHIRRANSIVVDGNCRPGTTYFGRCHHPLFVNGNSFGTGGLKLINQFEQIFIMNQNKFGSCPAWATRCYRLG